MRNACAQFIACKQQEHVLETAQQACAVGGAIRPHQILQLAVDETEMDMNIAGLLPTAASPNSAPAEMIHSTSQHASNAYDAYVMQRVWRTCLVHALRGSCGTADMSPSVSKVPM